ncbi:MAG: DSBA oxidoreductase [Candidatus Woesebacteria bacterium GW2011_GWA1_41_7]|uniref:DSBA oxidoreductase n=1 Tax=Candidatus Woesebacteria bacterium GW2011_GWA1_41_7 TaxID=1618556 RepID=A0A0G0WXK4_9BACT|nr:MAG: DSBA oxidoreductase [Candidatus Woesebacteria bacterium GW2011_GWA1_41_7]
MRDFFLRNKAFILICIVTVALVVGGVFLMSGQGSSSPSAGKVIDSSILAPDGVYKTSGFENGVYLAASPSATVTLVEFGDFQCPACAVYAPFVKDVLTEFPGKVTYVFRSYPLPQHKNAPISSYAVEAAGKQGKYWEMQEKLYETQNDWSLMEDPSEVFVNFAKELGLNTDQFSQDMGSQEVKDIVTKDTAAGNLVKITETPTFYINGKKVTLSGDPNQLKSLIQAELSK